MNAGASGSRSLGQRWGAPLRRHNKTEPEPALSRRGGYDDREPIPFGSMATPRITSGEPLRHLGREA